MGLFYGIILWDYSVIPLSVAFTQEQGVSRLLCLSHLFHAPRIDAI